MSDMNSKKRIKIPLNMARNKRKFSKSLVKKIQKIKSLNKAIHFLSPSVSFSYTKHRGSQMLKSKRKSLLTLMRTTTETGTTRRLLDDLSYLTFERTTVRTTIETTIGTNVGSRTRTTRRLDLLCEISQRTTASTDQPTIISNAASDQPTIISKQKKLKCVSNMNSNDKFRNPIQLSKILTKRRNFSKKLLNTCEINTKKKVTY